MKYSKPFLLKGTLLDTIILLAFTNSTEIGLCVDEVYAFQLQ